LIVTFPPQHLAEIAYFTTVEGYSVTRPAPTDPTKPATADPDASTGDENPDSPPIPAVIAGWSRLVFIVPDESLPIDWTVEGILAAIRDLELSVPANALPPRQPRRLRSPLDELIVQTGLANRAALVGAAAFSGTDAAARASVLAAARARRQMRTIGHALHLSE